MHALRHLFLHQRWLAALVVAAALAMKALIPAGYMVGNEGSRVLTIQICADSLGQKISRQIIVPMAAHLPGGKAHDGKAKAESPCAFSALGHAALGGADPVQLAAALLFVLALGFAPLVPAAPRRLAFLRPPLRGPPALG